MTVTLKTGGVWFQLVSTVCLLMLLSGGVNAAQGGSTVTVTMTDDTSDGTCDTHCSLREAIDIWQLGGAISRVDAGDTAFHTRTAPFMLGIESNWEDPDDDEANIAWARRLAAEMDVFSDGAQYFNFPGLYEAGEAAMRASFGANYNRLAAVKAKYDPKNLFRLNHNVQPQE